MARIPVTSRAAHQRLVLADHWPAELRANDQLRLWVSVQLQHISSFRGFRADVFDQKLLHLDTSPQVLHRRRSMFLKWSSQLSITIVSVTVR
jgi:hypothetical protein